MYTPDLTHIIPREEYHDGTETARSFRSWDTCMDNKVCRITASVGITVAVLAAIVLFFACVRGCRYQLTFAEAFCCCCVKRKRRDEEENAQVPQVPKTAPAVSDKESTHSQEFAQINGEYSGKAPMSHIYIPPAPPAYQPSPSMEEKPKGYTVKE